MLRCRSSPRRTASAFEPRAVKRLSRDRLRKHGSALTRASDRLHSETATATRRGRCLRGARSAASARVRDARPYEFFTSEAVGGEQPEHPAGRVIPLFSSHTGGIVFAFRESGGPRGFLWFCLEAPAEGQHGLSWEQLAVYLLIQVWENAPDDPSAERNVREAARLLHFSHVDSFLAACRTKDQTDFEVWRRAVIDALAPYEDAS